ncbi:MAG: NADH-quinone oxidoreductase subunit J [Candidatus Cloacimonetes bacterium]|nr:NADH-quinone oxidoreductase subunit J [Candidatus Cloacimonadota bacterium]
MNESTFSQLLFYVLAASSIFSALSATFMKDFFKCALSFILLLLSVAGLFLQMNMPFLAALQVLVYAGGITVLILFGIMMIYQMGAENSERLRSTEMIVAAGVSIFSLGFVFIKIFSSAYPNLQINSVGFLSSPKILGESLLNQFLLSFDILSVLLLAVLIATSALVRKGVK